MSQFWPNSTSENDLCFNPSLIENSAFIEEFFLIQAFLKVVVLHLLIEEDYHQQSFFLSSLYFQSTFKKFWIYIKDFNAITFFKVWFYTSDIIYTSSI